MTAPIERIQRCGVSQNDQMCCSDLFHSLLYTQIIIHCIHFEVTPLSLNVEKSLVPQNMPYLLEEMSKSQGVVLERQCEPTGRIQSMTVAHYARRSTRLSLFAVDVCVLVLCPRTGMLMACLLPR